MSKQGKKNNQEEDTLWSNPMVRAALKALSPEQLDHYKKIGEEMYNSVNFVDSKIINNLPVPMAEAAAYVVEGLKSGIHPSDLDPNEHLLMTEAYGPEWYTQFGYTKEDLHEMNVKDVNVEKAK